MRHLAYRKYSIIYIVVLISVVLICRTAYLQLISSKYREQAQKTTLEKKLIYPSRGVIFDRNDKTLVYNKTMYNIYAVYNKIDPQMDTTLFCSLLGIDKQTFTENLNKDWKSPKYHKSVPFVFLSKVSPEQYAFFQEHMYQFPGFIAEERGIRGYNYPYAAHVLGYLGEVDRKIIENSAGWYVSGDFIGRTGLEIAYEKYLGGKKGVTYILKDNLGRQVGSYDDGRLDSMAVPGEDMVISLDIDLQAYADSLMMNKRGALVAIEPSTGEILAMVSAPSYDPNYMSLDGVRNRLAQQLLLDTINRPLNNRAVTSKYPPGSIFKPIMSLVALQKGVAKPNKSLACFGGFRLSATKIQKCHRHPVIRNVADAIKYSCNTYYFEITNDFLDMYGFRKPGIGLDTLVSYLKDFGLGDRLGMDYSYESRGFIPDSKYYDRRYRKEVNGWRSMWVLSLGIGQGEMQLTTVQMANLAAILANRGYFYTPHFLKRFKSGKSLPPEIKTRRKVRIDPKHFPPVIDGLEAVVTGGTARVAYVPGLDICGKTGTSQNPHGEDHSVFFGFAPKNKPKIAVAVFVENAGWGGDWAAPISSLLIEKYLNKQIAPGRKALETRMIQGLVDTSPPEIASLR